jgi:hypothetical protein
VKAEVDLGVIGFPSLSHNNIVNENHELNQFVFFFFFFFNRVVGFEDDANRSNFPGPYAVHGGPSLQRPLLFLATLSLNQRKAHYIFTA